MNRHLASVLDHLFVLRIPLLAPVWTVLMLGWLTGTDRALLSGWFAGGFLRSGLDVRLWYCLAAFSLTVASIYVVNQIVDIDSDRINNKLFLLPRKLVSVKAAWVIAALCAAAGVSMSVPAGPVLTAVFGLSLLTGVSYNLPPLLLKNRPWGGMIANFLGHGMLTYLVGWCAAQPEGPIPIVRLQSGVVSSLAAGFANAAVFLVTTVADSAGDRATGKRTFAVAYGDRATAIMAALLCLGAFVAAFFITHGAWIMILPAGCSLVFFTYFALSVGKASPFKTFKWPVFLLTVCVCAFVPLYGVLILVTFTGSRWYYRRRFNIEYPSFRST